MPLPVLQSDTSLSKGRGLEQNECQLPINFKQQLHDFEHFSEHTSTKYKMSVIFV